MNQKQDSIDDTTGMITSNASPLSLASEMDGDDLLVQKVKYILHYSHVKV